MFLGEEASVYAVRGGRVLPAWSGRSVVGLDGENV